METTEQKIINAAREEFIATGLKGARMQSIADRAGVNKALLHYYFRSKEKLYETSVSEVVELLWSSVEKEILLTNQAPDLRSMIQVLVTTYIKTMSSNPLFVRIVIREIADGGTVIPIIAERIAARFAKIPMGILKSIADAMKSGVVRNDLKPLDILINILGACAITFIMMPIAQNLSKQFGFKFDCNDEFYKSRINSIVAMACDGIFVKVAKV